MANKEKIDYLLLDIQKLETMIAKTRDAEIYPASFFNQSFELTHKILKELHALEALQVEQLCKQMEAHQALIDSIPDITVTEPILTNVVSEEKISEPIVEQKIVSSIETIPTEQIEKTDKPFSNERSGLFLNDLLEKNNLSDFRKAFSLNDRFRFRRELFGGDEERMNKAIHELNNLHSYEDSMAYLNNELKWNIEDEAVADFIKLLEKRFL
ncbi:MAG: hypothetical protein E7085_10315 [Parabacteroides distasonis]|nr:hypothetical protein [Parabacteroides distasonis]MBQ4161286.1 hypothetical protein [Parabacteroides sp.]